MGRRGRRHPCASSPVGPSPAGGGRGSADGHRRIHGAVPFGAPGRAGRRLPGLGGDRGRMRQRLHVLHRAVRPGRAAIPGDRRRARGSAGARAPGRRRGDAPRTERQHLRARRHGSRDVAPTTLREAVEASERGRRAPADPVHVAASPRLHAGRDRGDGREREGLRAHPLPAAVGVGRRVEGDAAFLPARALPGVARSDPRRDPGRCRVDRHHRRVPGRDRRAFRRHARCGRSRPFRFGLHVPVLPATGYPGRLDARPCPEGGRAGAVRAARGAAGGDLARESTRADRHGGRGAGRGRRATRASSQSRTRTNRIVHLQGTLEPGTFVTVRITDAAAHHLSGEVVPAPALV